MTEETIEYRGYTIDVVRDEFAANPFTDWDCNPPLLASHGRDGVTEYGLDTDLPRLTREQIRANAKDIAEHLNCKTLLRAVRLYEPFSVLGQDSVEAVNNAIAEYASGLYRNGSDHFSLLAECWRWAGYQALDTCTTGYCQGHYADVLVVATPEWLKEVGLDPTDTERIQKNLEGAAELYGHWCWGDVYGYQITGPEREELDDTCFGFYGIDHEASGLLQDARSVIDYQIKMTRQHHLRKLKTWIKHRVPLWVREESVRMGL
jgi:hypothetical protein